MRLSKRATFLSLSCSKIQFYREGTIDSFLYIVLHDYEGSSYNLQDEHFFTVQERKNDLKMSSIHGSSVLSVKGTKLSVICSEKIPKR